MFLEDERLNSLMGLDEPMGEFIQKYVNSFVKWEIVQYFHSHPDTPYKTEELAKILNRPVEQVRRELQELSQDDLLVKQKAGKQALYCYALLEAKTKEDRAVNE